MRRRDGLPQWIVEEGDATPLVRADLGGKVDGSFNEAWLQNLLHRRPEVFPIEQIEPGFGDLVPLCRELPVIFGAGRSGALDNLYATASGGLVLVEAKLWRNPEARRSVVAQAMEYAGAVFRMSFDDLERRVLKARAASDAPASSLFEIVSATGSECEEAEFVDAVSRNLRRGRAIIAVVGDGIREDILPLAELLQSHAGHRFTFALVELAVYDTPVGGVRVIVPSVLAQTELIERGVIRIEGDAGAISVSVEEPSAIARQSSPPRRFGIGEDEYFEVLAAVTPEMPVLLKAFLEKADKLGVYVDLQGAMNLKHASASGQPLNLGTISKAGYVDTGPTTWWGRKPAGQTYNETLAASLGGLVSETKDGTQSALRTSAGKTPRLSDLLPMHEQTWLDAMDKYILSMTQEPDHDQPL